jgi:cysteine desulfurase family protein (TIGR01976 family)
MSAFPSVAAIRADFPAFDPGNGGRAPLRFDGPGGTQVPTPVITAMVDYLTRHNGNSHWHFPASRETDQLVLDARQRFATFFGGRPDEVVFGPNMTSLTFHLARGLARGWQPGDEVIVTELDHHGNVAPWEAVAADRGLVLRWLRLDPDTGLLDLDALPALLNARTRLLAITAASNALGTMPDVARASAMAHNAGALVMVDAVHYAPHRLVDVHALGADFLGCSPYKFYGPHLGVLWGRHELLAALDIPKLRPAPAEPPERLETGTPSFEAIAGAAAAVEWLAGLSGSQGDLRSRLANTYHELHLREVELFGQLWSGLQTTSGIRTYGPPPGERRTGTVSSTKAGESCGDLANRLAAGGCSVSHGDFYAATAAERCGVAPDGWLRIGLSAYHDADEVSRLLELINS